MFCECRHTRSSRLTCSLRHVSSSQVPLGINIMPSWRRVLSVGGSVAALCVARDMNMFLACDFTNVLCAEVHGSELDWPHVLLTWVAGLRATCTSQPKKAIRWKRQGTRSCSHGRRLYFDGPRRCFVVHTSVPLPQVGREACARILVMAKEVSMCCHRSAKTNCSVVAQSASGSSATLPSATISKTPASQCGSRAITWSHLLFRLSGTIKEIDSFM